MILLTLDKILELKKPKEIKLLDVAKALDLSKQGLFYHINQGRKGLNSLSYEQMKKVVSLLDLDISIFFEN